MRFIALAALALTLVSCKPAEKPADAAMAAAPEPTWAVVVLYNQPKDTAAFEKYYWETHVPLVGANQKEIGFVKAELVRFPSNLDGSKPAFAGSSPDGGLQRTVIFVSVYVMLGCDGRHGAKARGTVTRFEKRPSRPRLSMPTPM